MTQTPVAGPGSEAAISAAVEPLRIRFYSDCYVFGGAENMLVVMLEHARMRDDIRISLSYRMSPAYQVGVRSRIPSDVETTPIRLPKPEIWDSLRGTRRQIVKALAHTLFLRQWCQLWDTCRLMLHFLRTHPAVVHVNNGGFPATASCNAAAVAARLARVPIVVYSVNGTARSYRSPLRWADYPLDRLTARCVDCFVTGAGASAEALRRVLRLDAEHVRALPNGIVAGRPHETREETRRRLGCRPDTVVFLLVARMDGMKGHDDAIGALARLLEMRREIDPLLVFAGNGPEERRLRAAAAALGLSSHVRFLVVPHEHVWALYQASEVVILPSLDEDFPYSVLEAMAMERPVIGSRVGGIPEQVIEGKTGLLVPPENEEALAAAFVELAGNADQRTRLGYAGRARFESLFTADAAAARYQALYAELTAARGKPHAERATTWSTHS